MSGKCYPEEFKIEAAKQGVDRGHSVSSLATRLGITTHTALQLTVILSSTQAQYHVGPIPCRIPQLYNELDKFLSAFTSFTSG
jgi:transposase